ncbi:MAG: metallophosphoesterase [Opitutales bacterium]|nr:metallophosphoesterase [Opitutales bacterium]
MKLWLIISGTALALFLFSTIFLIVRAGNFEFLKTRSRKIRLLAGTLIVAGTLVAVHSLLGFVNALVVALYFTMIWIVCDIASAIFCRIRRQPFPRYYAGYCAVALSLAALGFGWYQAHHVVMTSYELTSEKIGGNAKIAFIADAHLGTTFDADGFKKELEKIQRERPDLLAIVGDFVDDDSPREMMVEAVKALGEIKTTWGVYFVFGNHDKAYYGAARRGFSAKDLVDEMEKSGIVVLRDESRTLGNAIELIGRRDFSVERESNGKRLSMTELTRNVDPARYQIVLDHQPADYENQAAANVDLVLSGHTHGGQLFPFNKIGKWIGANDRVYGHERRGNTDFIVTSGISDWAIKFKTGTVSEFVIVKIRGNGFLVGRKPHHFFGKTEKIGLVTGHIKI